MSVWCQLDVRNISVGSQYDVSMMCDVIPWLSQFNVSGQGDVSECQLNVVVVVL